MAQNKPSAAALAAQQRLQDYQEKQAVHQKKQRRNQRITLISVIAAVVVLALALSSQFIYNAIVPAPSSSPKPTSYEEALRTIPDKSIAQDKMWDGTLDLVDMKLGLELDGKNAPQAVANALNLSFIKFYEGLGCHRLTTEGIYVLQCGDPNGDGTGGGPYDFGPIENAPADNIYPAGTIAMARRGNDGNSMSSQFFIVYKDSVIPADQAGGYTVLGRVTSGLNELINKYISAGTANGTTDGPPAADILINKLLIG